VIRLPRALETRNRARLSRHGTGRALDRRLSLVSLAILLIVMGGMGSVVATHYHGEETLRFSSLTTTTTSWNPNVVCTPSIVLVSDILGSSYPSQSLSGSSWRTSSTSGGIPVKRALSPPCTLTNLNGQVVSTFVQIDNLSLSNYFYETRDCSTSFNSVNNGGAPYPNGQTVCDSTGDMTQVGSNNGAYVHGEIDQDWMVQGYCGPTSASCNNSTLSQLACSSSPCPPCTIPSPCSITAPLDVQGFVYWDPEGHWELHPLTAWRIAGLSASFSTNPTSPTVGQTVTFTGAAAGGTAPYSFKWNFGDGMAATGATTTHSFNAKGIYTVRLNATDSTGKNSVVSESLSVDVPDFAIVANPTTLVIWLAAGSLTGFIASLTIMNIRAHSRLRLARGRVAQVREQR
jgi:hypothetical protein